MLPPAGARPRTRPLCLCPRPRRPRAAGSGARRPPGPLCSQRRPPPRATRRRRHRHQTRLLLTSPWSRPGPRPARTCPHSSAAAPLFRSGAPRRRGGRPSPVVWFYRRWCPWGRCTCLLIGNPSKSRCPVSWPPEARPSRSTCTCSPPRRPGSSPCCRVSTAGSAWPSASGRSRAAAAGRAGRPRAARHVRYWVRRARFQAPSPGLTRGARVLLFRRGPLLSSLRPAAPRRARARARSSSLS